MFRSSSRSVFSLVTGTTRGLGGRKVRRRFPDVDEKHPKGKFFQESKQKRFGARTRRSGFLIQWSKVPDIVVPDLTEFELKPYVSEKAPKIFTPPLDSSIAKVTVSGIVTIWFRYCCLGKRMSATISYLFGLLTPYDGPNDSFVFLIS